MTPAEKAALDALRILAAALVDVVPPAELRAALSPAAKVFIDAAVDTLEDAKFPPGSP